jgi:hypothetical protein
MQALVSQESSLISVQTRYSQLEASVVQRLRWAAGANPTLNLVLKQFEESANYRKLIYEVCVCVRLFIDQVYMYILCNPVYLYNIQ